MIRLLELIEAVLKKGATIRARFPGSCPVCGGGIRRGEKIGVVNKVWMHSKCADDVVRGDASLPGRGVGSQRGGAGGSGGWRHVGVMKVRPGGVSPGQKSVVKNRDRKPTEKQIRYALSLIRRLGRWGWHDSDYGQAGGGPPPNRAELESWTAGEVSDLISSLRAEF